MSRPRRYRARRALLRSACLAAVVSGALAPVQLGAQDSDGEEEEAGGLLVGFLEDTLSGDSRYIKVTGLSGAFSSQATIERITVADEDGVWLTVEGAELDWNRLALLRGRFSVNTLSAERIAVDRVPEPVPQDPEMPEPEATPFQVPELPVAVEIAELNAGRIELGEALLGQPAALSVDGALSLADGALDSGLTIARLDREGDVLRLNAGYANESQVISLDVELTEAPGGLVSAALNMPDEPSVRLLAQGEGPVSDFSATVELDTDGERRLGGTVVLAGQGADAEDPNALGFTADFGGNIDPMLQEQYRPFFGEDISAVLRGQRTAEGRLTLESLEVQTQALALSGAVDVAPGGALDTADIQAAITPPNGDDTVVLPFGDGTTTLGSAEVSAVKEDGSDWQISAVLAQIGNPAAQIASATIEGSGTLDQTAGFAIDGEFAAGLTGFEPRDPALAQAAGSSIDFTGRITTEGAGAFRVTGMTLAGSDYEAAGEVSFEGLDSGLQVTADLTAGAADLSRFSGLAGRPLGGSVQGALKGHAAPLSGAFGVDLQMRAEDLSAGIERVDELIAGATTLELAAERGETGIRIDNFTLEGTQVSAQASGQLDSDTGALSASARIADLGVLVPQVSGPLEFSADAERSGNTLSGTAALAGPDQSSARLDGSIDLDGNADFDFETALDRLDRFLPDLEGQFTATGSATRRDGTWEAEGKAEGPAGIAADLSGSFSEDSGDLDAAFDAAVGELQAFVPQISGALRAEGTAQRRGTLWSGAAETSGTAGIDGSFSGTFDEEGDADLSFDAAFRRLERLVPQITGDVTAKGAARRRDGYWIGDAETSGSAGVEAAVSGRFDEARGDLNATFDGAFRRLQRLVPQLEGDLTAEGTVSRLSGQWRGEARTGGSAGIEATASGAFDQDGGDADIDFDGTVRRVGRLVPQISGDLTAEVTANRREGLWQGDGSASGPAGLDAGFSATFEEASGEAEVSYDAAIARLQELIPDLPGALTAEGTATRSGEVWTIDTSAAGPAGIDARVAGSFDQGQGTADMTARGQLRLEGANPFITPNLMQGAASFDLALQGPPSAESVSGTISTSGATLALPAAAQRIDNINANIGLGEGRANIQISAQPRDGGSVQISGPLGLTPPLDSNLQIAIRNVVLTDNLVYDTTLNGDLSVSGALAGSSLISGRIDVGETNINLNAAGGSVSSAPIPPIRHMGESSASRLTRARAGLIETGSGGSGNGSGPDIGLDVLISAPSRIFARGRGLRSELGGQIRLRGTVANLAPSGQISLIRGTFDILGQRLELDEGRISLLGDLKPYLEFRSTATTDEGTATLEISGFLDTLEIKVTSDPPRPSEEALALLLFGDNINDISPLALARVAGSALELSGRGGGTEGRLREGTGADNVDIGLDNLGAGLLGIGGYISDNIYTDFNVNTQGDGELSINLDVTKSLTVTGTVDNEGETGLGMFFKRDY